METANKIALYICIVALLTIAVGVNLSYASEPTKQKTDQYTQLSLEQIMQKLTQTTKELTSLEGDMEYKFIQDPELFESTTLNKGKLYYKKSDERSWLRISFTSRQEDDLKPEQYREEFIFDGCWLTRINYSLKQINMDQLAEDNKPVEVFDLISANLPLIGFSNTEQLSKDFSINIVSQEKALPIHLKMQVKEDSRYYEKYKKIDFYIDPELFLPIRIISKTPEDDIYDITFAFSKESVNKKLDDEFFKVETPAGFDKNITELKKQESL